MKLRDLLNGLEHRKTYGRISAEIGGLAYDSRRVERGFVFVAIRGEQQDGHDYVAEAIERGA